MINYFIPAFFLRKICIYKKKAVLLHRRIKKDNLCTALHNADYVSFLIVNFGAKIHIKTNINKLNYQNYEDCYCFMV